MTASWILSTKRHQPLSRALPMLVLVSLVLSMALIACAGQSDTKPLNGRCPPCVIKLAPNGPEISVTAVTGDNANGSKSISAIVIARNGLASQNLPVKQTPPVLPDDVAVRGIDLNSDGFQDLEIITRRGAANAYADYWLFSPGSNQFIALGNYPILTIDRQNHVIKSYERNGAAGLSYSAKQYALVGQKLEVTRSEDQSETKRYGYFELVVSQRINGGMRVTSRKIIKAPPAQN